MRLILNVTMYVKAPDGLKNLKGMETHNGLLESGNLSYSVSDSRTHFCLKIMSYFQNFYGFENICCCPMIISFFHVTSFPTGFTKVHYINKHIYNKNGIETFIFTYDDNKALTLQKSHISVS